MKQTNSQLSQFYIALKPTALTTELKEMTQLCDATSLTLNVNDTKVDTVYFCNSGGSTSIITGRSTSIAVSVDFDINKPSHKYLLEMFKGDVGLSNNQFIQLKYSYADNNTVDVYNGNACVQFTSMPPAGIATDLAKLEFEVFPQDENFYWSTEVKPVKR